MKFNWKYWLPHFITWFLLLIVISCCIWLINKENKRLKILGNSFYNYKSSGSSKELPGIDFIGAGNKKPKRQPPKKEKENNGKPEELPLKKDDKNDKDEE